MMGSNPGYLLKSFLLYRAPLYIGKIGLWSFIYFTEKIAAVTLSINAPYHMGSLIPNPEFHLFTNFLTNKQD